MMYSNYKRLTTITLIALAAFLVSLGIISRSLAADSYLFPARAEDLEPGAYWWVSGHDSGHARDLVVKRFDKNRETWTSLKPDVDPDQAKKDPKNEDRLIYSLPVYALADGDVVSCWRNAPENPAPGTPHAGRDGCGDEDQDGNVCEHHENCSCTILPGGNHMKILTSDEQIFIHAHLKPGSIPASLCPHSGQFVEDAADKSAHGHNPEAYMPEGQRPQVKKGQFLGLAGNSGKSSGPHLHISKKECNGEDCHLVPLRLHGAWIQQSQNGSEASLQNWQRLNGPLPVDSPKYLVLPDFSPGFKEIARHGIPASNYQFTFDRITKSSYRLVWVDGFNVNGKVYFNAIFRPSNGTQWKAYHNLTATKYQQKFDQNMSQGFRLVQVDSYPVGNKIRYAAIFVKYNGPAIYAYHSRTPQQHQDLFDDLTKQGWRPKNISVVSINGNRWYTALYVKKNVGSYWAKSFLTPPQYQEEFDKNKMAGRQLVYLNAYEHNGKPRFTAIWNSVTTGQFKARHGLSSGQYQQEWEEATSAGLLTRAVTGYAQGNEVRYAALWRK